MLTRMDFGKPKECLKFEARLLEAKKWKTRSFVAHQLNDGSGASQLKVYKKGKPKKTISFDDYYGIESGALIHGELFTLSVICECDTLVFAFDDENGLLEFENWLRSYLRFGCCFHCYVLSAPSRSGLQAEQYVRLHLQDGRFCLVAGIPGSLRLKFLISDLQCYGAVRNKFCFQVKCDYSSPPEIYVLRSSHCQKMDAYFSLASGRHLHYFLLQWAMRDVSCEKVIHTWINDAASERKFQMVPYILNLPVQTEQSTLAHLIKNSMESSFKIIVSEGDNQRQNRLNEPRDPFTSTATARRLSFSCEPSGKEVLFDCRKPEARSSLSLNNEISDAIRWKPSETVHAESEVRLDQLCQGESRHFSTKRSATRRFMPHLSLSRRLKRTFVNEKHSAQSGANEEDVAKNWTARHLDSKLSPLLVANGQNDQASEYRDGRQMRLFARLSEPELKEKEGQTSVMPLAAVEISHTSTRRQGGALKSLPVPVSSPLPLVCTEIAPAANCTSQSTCAKLWETTLNSSGTRRRLRATLSSYIRGSFSCYDGDCPDEVPMVSSVIVPQERASNVSQSACLLKAPLSAPCLPQHATVFDFPSSAVADCREIVISAENVVKSKSNSLPCHGSRQKKLCNYVHIDMVATQAARKIASQRAEEFTGQSISASVLSGSEGALARK